MLTRRTSGAKQVIRIEKHELKKTRRQWIRKPQTQVLPRKARSSRKKEKQTFQKNWPEEILE